MRTLSLWSLALTFALAAHAGAQGASPPSTQRPTAPAAREAAPPPKVVSASLPNGMRLLLVEKRGSPTLAFHVMFRVGSVDEEQGRTGLAHLFEHMIFKGTRRLATRDWEREKPLLDEIERIAQELRAEREKGPRADPSLLKTLKDRLASKEAEADAYVVREEYEKLYEMNGARGLNAYTGEDRTAYVVELPSNRLEFWMAMEAERLRDPILREFYKERDVVMEERRMRTDSDPLGKLWEQLVAAAFSAHPYGHDVIGWMSDLQALSRTDAERFFKTHYGPNTAVAVVVGDLDSARALEYFKKYFGPLPAVPLAAHHITEEPEQLGPRRVQVEFEAEPMLMIGWHKPNLPSREDTALQMLSAILAEGRTSRFYKNLVEGKRIAVSVSADHTGVGERHPNLFVVWGEPRHPHTAGELEAGLLAEIERIKSEPPSDWEMEKVRNRLTAELVKSLESNQGMARRLAYYQTVAEDWTYPWKLQDRFREIQPQEVQAAARKYLTERNSTTATLVKPGGKAGPAQVMKGTGQSLAAAMKAPAAAAAAAQAPPAAPPAPKPTTAPSQAALPEPPASPAQAPPAIPKTSSSAAAPQAEVGPEALEFFYGENSAALGSAAQEALRSLASKALMTPKGRVRVSIRSLAKEDAKTSQRRWELAGLALQAGGLAPNRIDILAATGDKPGITAELVGE